MTGKYSEEDDVDQRVEHIQILIKLGRLRSAIEEAGAALAVVEGHLEANGLADVDASRLCQSRAEVPL